MNEYTHLSLRYGKEAMADAVENDHRRRSIRKASQSSYIVSRNAKIELREKVKKVSVILKKPEHERTASERALVNKNPEVVKTSQKNARRLQANKERLLEREDEPNLLLNKCEKLSDLIKNSKHVVVYTGAGISTAASIPDYRGPNGVWTLLKKGQELCPQDLSDAEPTYTHMSLTQLYRVGKVKHIVSQNCDGLHMRSGFPRHALSEVHGNMYIECCYNCAPHREYVRLFDVTERTGVHRHSTSRRCKTCGGNLKDTIVHFGEKGKLKSPYRWKEAVRAAKNADLILCLGSSLKVLRKYACLWCMDIKPQYRPKLVIVNLQWTPKDDVATLKINGKCDSVMMKVMKFLDYEVPEYEREKDPIFHLCSPLRVSEMKTTTKKILVPPSHLEFPVKQGKKQSGKGAKLKSQKLSKMVKSEVPHLSDTLHVAKNEILSSNSTSYSGSGAAGLDFKDDEFVKKEEEWEKSSMETEIDLEVSVKDETVSEKSYYPVMRSLLTVAQESQDAEYLDAVSCVGNSHDVLHDATHFVEIKVEDSDTSAVVSQLGDNEQTQQGALNIVQLSNLKFKEDSGDGEKTHSVWLDISQQVGETLYLSQLDNGKSSTQDKQGLALEKNEHVPSSTSFSSSELSLIATAEIFDNGESKETTQGSSIPEIVVIDLGKDDWMEDSTSMGQDTLLEQSSENNLFITPAAQSLFIEPLSIQLEPNTSAESFSLQLDMNSTKTETGNSGIHGKHYVVNLPKDSDELPIPHATNTFALNSSPAQLSSTVQINLSPQPSNMSGTEKSATTTLSLVTSEPYQCVAPFTPPSRTPQLNEADSVPFDLTVDQTYILNFPELSEQRNPQKSHPKYNHNVSDSPLKSGKVFEKVKDICLDHSYTGSQNSIKKTIQHPNEKRTKPVEFVNTLNTMLSKSVPPSLNTLISAPVTVDITGTQMQSGHFVKPHKCFVNENSFSECNNSGFHDVSHAQQLIFSSSSSSLHMNFGAMNKSVIGNHIISSSSPETSDDGTKTLPTTLPVRPGPTNVPLCVLNMDDMEIVYKSCEAGVTLAPSCDTSPSSICSIFRPVQQQFTDIGKDSLSSEASDLKSEVKQLNFARQNTDSLFGVELTSSLHIDSIASSQQNVSVVSESSNVKVAEMSTDSEINTLHHAQPNLIDEHDTHTDVWKPDINNTIMLKNPPLKPQGNKDKISTYGTGIRRIPIHAVVDRTKAPHLVKHEANNTGRENVSRKLYKRKQPPPSTQRGVPGWFGKGLALKKKRKL